MDSEDPSLHHRALAHYCIQCRPSPWNRRLRLPECVEVADVRREDGAEGREGEVRDVSQCALLGRRQRRA